MWVANLVVGVLLLGVLGACLAAGVWLYAGAVALLAFVNIVCALHGLMQEVRS